MTDEATLLERIAQYDTNALAQVYDQYYERIYRYVYYYLGQVGAAEDLTSNVFFRLLSAVRSGRSPHKNLTAWLYRVAHNLVVDSFRRQPAEELELAEWLESDEPDLTHTVEQRLQMERVRLALRELTHSQRQVIVLKFLQGMDSREVGSVLGKSEGAVDALQHRALLALRKALVPSQGAGGDGPHADEDAGAVCQVASSGATLASCDTKEDHCTPMTGRRALQSLVTLLRDGMAAAAPDRAPGAARCSARASPAQATPLGAPAWEVRP